MTIDHASVSRGSTVSSPNRGRSSIRALFTLLPYVTFFKSISFYPVPVWQVFCSPSIGLDSGRFLVFSLLSSGGIYVAAETIMKK